MKKKILILTILVLVIIIFIGINVNSDDEFPKPSPFHIELTEQNIFPPYNLEYLTKYIDLEKSIQYYYNTLENEYQYAKPNIYCTLYQLGKNEYTDQEIEMIKKDLHYGKDNYFNAGILKLLEIEFNEEHLTDIKNEFESKILDENFKNLSPLIIKNVYYQYLRSCLFFNHELNSLIKSEIITYYSSYKIPESLSIEFLLDMIIMETMGIGPEIQIEPFLANSWSEAGFFYLPDCDSFCEFKSIHLVTYYDMLTDSVPKKYLINMTAYLLSYQNDDGSYYLDDSLMYGNECRMFCNMMTWYVFWDLNHLIEKVDDYEDRIKEIVRENKLLIES